MHDFFVDRLVHTGGIRELASSVTEKANQGGGGIHRILQEEIRGGNAVNLAHALARLGLRVLLITHSDETYESLLKRPFEGLDAEIRAKPRPPGLTVALEGEVNVMLGHGGGTEDFGPELLDADDWKSLESAKVVCSVNWAANAQGTALLSALRRKLGAKKQIYFDPADFRDRVEEFASLLSRIRVHHLVDWMSLNEEEAHATGRILEMDNEDLGKVCSSVSKDLGVGLDVHTAAGSYSAAGGRVAFDKTMEVKALRLTGAGDVWDAGSIYGRLKNLGDEARLRFANTAARLYISAKNPTPPELEDVLKTM